LNLLASWSFDDTHRANRHFASVRAAYEKTTGNRWKKSDSDAYEQNGLTKLPAETIISAVEAVAQRSPVKINSFRYFVQELMALPDPGNRAWRKKQLEKIVRRVQDNAVGRADDSASDFVEDVKRACAREAVPFDNDIFNELVR
jgi:GTP cyclohydrolase FolE2